MALAATRGRWTDGRSAEDHAVSVVLDGPDLVVYGEAGAVLARFPVREARVHAVGDGDLVHVESAAYPDALLSLEDALFVSSLRHGWARFRGAPGGRRALAIGLGCFTVFVALMAAFYAGAPRLSEALAHRIPLSVEQKLAPQMTSLFSRNTCESPKADAAVRELMQRLAPERAGHVDVKIVNVGMANAFALPGGVVLLTRGLLEGAESGEEVAGVLAHELAHVERRHALSHMIRNALLGGLWAATIGDYSGMMIIDPKTAYETATLRYSREAEAEADADALEMLTLRRISSKGLVDFLKRNGKLESKDMTWLSSHPASEARMTELSHQTLHEPAVPALGADELYDLRKACDAAPARSFRDLFF